MLQTHYRQPIDWTVDRLKSMRSTLMDWTRLVHDVAASPDIPSEVIEAISDDLNTPAAMSALHELAGRARKDAGERARLRSALEFLGLHGGERYADFAVGVDVAFVETCIQERAAARKAKNFAESDRLRDVLKGKGVDIEDGPQGTSWRLI
jgi:cysteinyl-tRNA synthetase